MPVALRTPCLLLREWRDDDLEPFAAICADPEVMRYYPPKPDRAASDAWIARMRAHDEAHGFAYWAVELRGEANLIGAVGMSQTRFPPLAPAIEIGWRLARPYRGRGYATGAARAVIDDGFGRLGFDEVVAFTVPANRRSWRVMERLGMARDPGGDFDHPSLSKGDPLRRHILYRLCRAAR